MKLTPNSLMVSIWCIFRQKASIKSFRDFADKKVMPFIERQLATTKRVGVIWDRNLPDSLKATTRERMGAGIRKRMRHCWIGKFPRNWYSYLQNVSNKVELFHCMSVYIAQTVFCGGKVVIWTLGENVLTVLCQVLTGLNIRSQVMRPLGVRYENDVASRECSVARDGYKRILIIANYADITVLGIAFFGDIGDDKLWVSCGIGNKLWTISIDDICSTMSSAPQKQKFCPNSMPGRDQITHPSFRAREWNLLTKNGVRGQSSQICSSSDW